MDLFTHVLVAYLISYGLWHGVGLQYIAAGALAGGLPDADALFFPLAKRFPLLRHHGITHSITGVTIVAAVGAFVVPSVFSAVIGPSFAVGSTLLYFLAMEAGGLSHVFLDGFTHFSVPPLAPFSKYEFHLDADRAINFFMMVFTAVSFTLLVYERGRVPLAVWEWTSWILLAAYIGYLVVRGLGRWGAERARRAGGYNGVVPQANPFVFLLVDERAGGGRMRMRSALYRVVGHRATESAPLDVPTTAPPAGPVGSEREALERSYAPSVQTDTILGMTYHSASVRSLGDHFLVFWYSLEFSGLGRAAGVLAKVDRETGAVETLSAWASPKRFRWPASAPERSL